MLLLAACTSDPTTGHGHVPASSGPTSAPSPPKPPKPRITGLTAAWTWKPLGTVKAVLLGHLDSIEQDGKRVYTRGELPKRGANLSDYPTRVAAADLRTGRPLWSVTQAGASISMFVLPSVVVLAVYDRAPVLVGLDPATGKQVWQRRDLGSSLDAPVAVLGGALYATISAKSFDGVARLDPATGKITARSDAVAGYANLAAGADTLIADDGNHLVGFSAGLGTRKWSIKGSGSTTDYTDRVVGGVLVRIPEKFASPVQVQVQGLSLATGRRLWVAPIAYRINRDTVSAADGLLFFSSGDVMTAIDPARGGKTVWRTQDKFADHVGAAADTGNVLACGLLLLSAESRNAALYHLSELPRRGFGQDGCIAPPLATAPSSGRPGLVLVAAPAAVYAYSATTENAPPPNPDPLGRWGPVDPAQCGVDATATRTALTAQFGGTWTLRTADVKGDCEWISAKLHPGLTAQTVPLADASAARKHLDPRNPDGGCIRFGTGGTQRSIAVPGLPSGSGACYLSGYTGPLGRLPDAVTGVSVRDDKYFAVLVEGFAYRTVRAARGPQKVVALLRALAR